MARRSSRAPSILKADAASRAYFRECHDGAVADLAAFREQLATLGDNADPLVRSGLAENIRIAASSVRSLRAAVRHCGG